MEPHGPVQGGCDDQRRQDARGPGADIRFAYQSDPGGIARRRPGHEIGTVTAIETELAQLRERLLSWLLNDALQIWWAVGADKTGGGFHEAIDSAGKPVLAERRARVQARQ